MAAMIFNGFGTCVTKFSTAINRTLTEQIRVILIWVFFLAYPGFGHEEFLAYQLIGFLFIILGVLFFNRVLVFGPKCRLLWCPKEEPNLQEPVESTHSREEEVKDNVREGEEVIKRDVMGSKYGTFN